MFGRPWPRLALLASFLIAVALVAGFLDLTVTQIVLAMGAAYLLAVAVEWTASRRTTRSPEPAVVESAAAPAYEPLDDFVVTQPAWIADAVDEAEAQADAEPEADLEPEPEPEPEPARQLVAVPEPAREPEPEPEPERLAPAVATLPLAAQPQEWNLWELERLARDRAGQDPARDEEWGYLVVYLREFASPDGVLPTEFDELVRDSFGELIAARGR